MGRTWRRADGCMSQRTEGRTVTLCPGTAEVLPDEAIDEILREDARTRASAPPETPMLDAAADEVASPGPEGRPIRMCHPLPRGGRVCEGTAEVIPDPSEERIREFVRRQQSDPSSLYYVPPEEREQETPEPVPEPLTCYPVGDGHRICEGTAEILPDPMEQMMRERAERARHDPLSLEYEGPREAPVREPRPEPLETRLLEGDVAVEGEGIHAWGSVAELRGDDGRLGLLTTDHRWGGFEEDGATRYGITGRGEFLGGEYGENSFSMLGFGYDAWGGEDGFSLGVGATVLGGVGGLEHDPTRADGAGRFGLSEGPSLGLRGHWGDTDGDQRREYGIGFDIGPVTYDVSDEDWLGTLAEMVGLGPDGMVAPPVR